MKQVSLFFALLLLSLRTQKLYGLAASKQRELNAVPDDIFDDSVKYLEDPNIQTISPIPYCFQTECKYICTNGKAEEIPDHIENADAITKTNCSIIEELRIYNYDFANNTLTRAFLGNYANRIEALYIFGGRYMLSAVEKGAFGHGIYKILYFKDTNITFLDKDFFENISSHFESLTIWQRHTTVSEICSTFLDQVRFQIKYLSLQAGLSCVRNLTSSNNLLNALTYADFSYNKFGDNLIPTNFEKLSMVEHLDLSHSEISYLPEYIFAEISTSLTFLDLSHNRLKTISKSIFGWHPIPIELKIIANENDWQCDCELHREMQKLYPFNASNIQCAGPGPYEKWSVFDENLCQVGKPLPIMSSTSPSPIRTSEPTLTSQCMDCETSSKKQVETTSTMSTAIKDDGSGSSPGEVSKLNNVEVKCRSTSSLENVFKQLIQQPTLKFKVGTPPGLIASITVESKNSNDSHGLVWFNKITKHYYKVDVNYNDFGLGCYGAILHTANVEDLLPNLAYTFCLVSKDVSAISPFNCRSAHISSNLRLSYNIWLTRKMRPAGISLVIFGIIMFLFLGILLTYLVLRHKPTLLKGSKRVAVTNATDIVVFPKATTLCDFKKKEQLIRGHNSTHLAFNIKRSNSTDSMDSTDSYINANLYEIIPTYLSFDSSTIELDEMPTYAAFEAPVWFSPPSTHNSTTTDSVDYAEIPYRKRTIRISSDPLPELPPNESSFSLSSNTTLSAETDDSGVDYELSHYREV